MGQYCVDLRGRTVRTHHKSFHHNKKGFILEKLRERERQRKKEKTKEKIQTDREREKEREKEIKRERESEHVEWYII